MYPSHLYISPLIHTLCLYLAPKARSRCASVYASVITLGHATLSVYKLHCQSNTHSFSEILIRHCRLRIKEVKSTFVVALALNQIR